MSATTAISRQIQVNPALSFSGISDSFIFNFKASPGIPVFDFQFNFGKQCIAAVAGEKSESGV